MSKYQRGHNEYQTKVHVAEATTGQLILYTCGVLGLMAFVFGAGVLVGRVDHSVNPSTGETTVTATAETPSVTPGTSATETYTVPAFASPEGEAPTAQEGEKAPAQSSPAATAGGSAAPAAPEGESGGDTVAARDPDTPKPKNIFMTMAPRRTSMDPLPSNRSKPIQVEAPVREPKPDPAATSPEGEAPAQPPAGTPSTAVQTAPPPPQPAAQPPAAPAAPQQPPELTPVEAPIEDLPLEPLDPPQPEKTASANVPAVTGGHKFGIQLIAYNGADRRAKAEALCGKVQKDSGLQAAIIPSEDDAYYRVVVVGYADRASADKALGEVRAKTGFKDAFIKPL